MLEQSRSLRLCFGCAPEGTLDVARVLVPVPRIVLHGKAYHRCTGFYSIHDCATGHFYKSIGCAMLTPS